MKPFLVVVALGFLVGCQAAPPTPASAPIGSLTADLKSEGDALAANGDFQAAATKYQAAVNQAPGDLKLRYALGYALSHLGRRGETVEQFRWVVEHGDRHLPEVKIARSWLVNAGELREEPVGGTGAARRRESFGPKGTIRGKTEWPAIGTDSTYRLELALWGDDPGTAGRVSARYVALGQPYVFEKVPPGAYRLTGRWGDMRLWEVRVTAAAMRETVLDLTPANSGVSTNDFPPRSSEADHGVHHHDHREHHPSSRDFVPPGHDGG